MHYLLDGYNLAHWLAPGDHDLTPHELRHMLLEQLAGRLPGDAASVAVYWDVRNMHPGIPARENLGWCVQHNVPDADAAILDAVYDAARPHECTVVSRDREVTGKARQLGARTMKPIDLLAST